MNTDNKYPDKSDFFASYQNDFEPISTYEIIKEAKNIFDKSDFPTTKNENWRKTDISDLLKHRFVIGKKTNIDKNTVNSFNLSGINTNILVFVNGFFVEELSNIVEQNNSLEIKNLSTAKKENFNIFEKYFNKTQAFNENIFSTFNTLNASNGAFVLIKKNSVVENPIHIYHFADGNNQKTMSLMRNLIVAESGSKAHLITSYHPLSNDFFLTNIITEIFTENNSFLDFNVFQGEGNNSYQLNLTKVQQFEGSKFHSNYITMCGKITRNDLNVKILGENCYSELNGIYMPDREQHIDNSLFVEHTVGHSESKQFYRGVIDNKATAVFEGKSLIEKNAIKTNINQKNNNILLTPYAKIHSKPQLIIHNDDVTASHGSTVGQLDKEALFYLQTRGIGLKRAKTLLLSAFVDEVLNKIQVEKFKIYCKFLAEKRLYGEKIDMQCVKFGECRIC